MEYEKRKWVLNKNVIRNTICVGDWEHFVISSFCVFWKYLNRDLVWTGSQKFSYSVPESYDLIRYIISTGKLRSKIAEALLCGTTKPSWAIKFKKFGLIKFVGNSDDAYTDLEFNEVLDGSGLSSVYYWNDNLNYIDIIFYDCYYYYKHCIIALLQTLHCNH